MQPTPAVASKPAAIRVLLIEDSPVDARLIRAMLSNPRGRAFELVQVNRLDEGLQRLAQGDVALVLLDLSLPDSRGMESFQKVHTAARHLPVIVMSGLDDETIAVSAVHAGAQDYLVKGEVTGHLLVRAIRYAIERKRAAEALQQAEGFYRSLVESLPQHILRKDLEGHFTFGNQRFLTELGMPMEQLVGKTDFDFFPAELARKYQEDDRQVIATGKIFETVEEHEPPGGGKRYVQVVKTPIHGFDGSVIGTQGIFWDVTERKLAEEQLKRANWELARGREESLKMLADLRRAHNELKEAQLELIQMEKMQMVGRLAAGVAHEVKNPLAIIRMGLDFLSGNAVVAASNADAVVKDMTDAVRRADAIIMGLLDFSAPGKLVLEEAELNGLLEDSLNMVKHELAGTTIKVVTKFASGLPAATVDPNKIKQAFVNLLTNAIHAMPDGGTLTVHTSARQLAEEEISPDHGSRETSVLHAGDWVVTTAIEDSGTGITPERLALIFDPFFTTKATGKGTGLGLTVTKKIVELHGGTIQIGNRPEGGVRVDVALRAKRGKHGQETNTHR